MGRSVLLGRCPWRRNGCGAIVLLSWFTRVIRYGVLGMMRWARLWVLRVLIRVVFLLRRQSTTSTCRWIPVVPFCIRRPLIIV